MYQSTWGKIWGGPLIGAGLWVWSILFAGADEIKNYAPDEILVRYKSGTTASEIRKVRRAINAERLEKFSIVNVQHYKLEEGTSVEETLAKLKKSSKVLYAEPNFVLEISQTPNDPDFSKLYGMHNTSQTGGTADADMDGPEAWDVRSEAPNMTIAVIDTGVDYNHPDLAANMWTNPGETAGNGIDDDGNGYVDDVRGWDFYNNDKDPMDDHYHGTHVAGTIAAVGNNGVGVAGVVWKAKIMPLKFLSGSGSGYTSGAISAINYATKMGAKISNNSWGGGGYSQALKDAITANGNAGALFVAAAGNSGANADTSPMYPAAYDNASIVSVAATDHNDALAYFSNYGAATVDLGAPGVSIYSTAPNNQYKTLSGTSMATPHVAGAAALIWAHMGSLTNLQVKEKLMLSADPISALSGKTVSGARLNVYNFMDSDSTAPSPVTDLSAQGVSFFSVTLGWTATGDDGATGKASFYELRYASSPITESTWDSAVKVSGLSSPKSSGQSETFKVSGLAVNTTYYFALKAKDNVGNTSALSNVISATTTQGTLFYTESFENGLGSWTTGGTNGKGGNTLWHLSTRRALSPTHAFYYGDESKGNFDTGYANNGWLISPKIFLTSAANSTLIFNQYLVTENLAPYDEASVQISSDNGATWTKVYKSYSSKGKWEQVTLDLASYDGKTILIKFYFNTLDAYYNSFEGWYVDDVKLMANGIVDTSAPAAITTLAATASTTNAVTLAWTATGDDGAAGTATLYDLRYSASPITDSNFLQAVSVSGLGSPKAAGTAESFQVSALARGTAYYFAIKAYDDFYNASLLSNVLSVQTKMGPKVEVTPTTLPKITLDVGLSTTQSLTIKNSGDESLTFEILEAPSASSSQSMSGAPEPLGMSNSLENVSYAPGQILVKFKQGVSEDAVRNLSDSLDARTVKVYSQIGVELIETAAEMDAMALARSFMESGLVDYAEPNFMVRATAMPNDPSFSSLYGLHNTGQTGGKADADIDSPEAWDTTKGSASIVVGVIDTGVDYTHPDLAANIWSNPGEIAGNGIDDDANGYVDDIRGWDFANEDNDPMDDHSHGTHVSGTIGGVGNNGIGVAGVNWTVKIIPLKFLSAGGWGYISDALEAVLYTNKLRSKGINVVLTSNSWGGGGYSQAFYDALAAADAAGILFIAAAGNSASNNDYTNFYPANYKVQNVISVAATDHNDGLAYFSSYGPTTVHLGAPGVAILSTLPGNNYGQYSGTSMATPHVAGACALVWAANPSWSHIKVKNQIVMATDKISSLSGKVISQGRLNVSKALATLEGTPPADVTDLTAAMKSFSVIELSWTATGDDGSSGTASAYEIRYSSSPITSANFSSATKITSAPSPKPAGSKEILSITGLTQKTTYYFALKATDDVGNSSGLSNVASTATDAAVELYINDLESSSGWTATGLWHHSTRRAASPTHAFYYGDATKGNYNTGYANKGTLTSPVLDLTAGNTPQLSFKYWRQVESYPGPYDKTYLEISKDGGSTWSLVWYKDSKTASEQAWTSSGPLDLTSYKGNKVLFRFTFDTVDAYTNSYEGFYVDDIQILDAKTDFAWLSAQPASGTVSANQASAVTLTYNAAALTPGTYKGNIKIKSNDPMTPHVLVPVELVIYQDIYPPAAITDLKVTALSSNTTLTLAWTAPGDDGLTGTASSYEIRYANFKITDGNFSKATLVSNPPVPKAAGGVETLTLSGLDLKGKNNFYYVAVKTKDNAGNVSALSNVVWSRDLDSDSDGLCDQDELNFGSDPLKADTDSDGMNDLYEWIAGTNPTSDQSRSVYLFKDDFNDGNFTGWSASGVASNSSWSAATSELTSSVIGSGGYAFLTAANLDISGVASLAVAYDVTFDGDSDGWGGFLFRGVHLDVNAHRSGWRDGSYEGHSGSYQWYRGVSDKGKKHHVLLLIRAASPYYLSDLYIDGKPVFKNEPMEVSSFATSTIGVVSNYYKGKVSFDNVILWPNPNPMLLPFSDNFDNADYGAWVNEGNTAISWSLANGAVQESPAVSGSGYGFFKHALLDLGGKDIVYEYDVTFQNGDKWGGLYFRGAHLDVNGYRSGWRDGSYEGHGGSYQWYSGLSTGTQHHVTLVIRQASPYPLSTLYIDEARIFQNEPIEMGSFADTSLGLASNYFSGTVLFDNVRVRATKPGANLAPILLSQGTQSVSAGHSLSFQLKAIDPDNDTLSYSVTGLPAGASFNAATGQFTWATTSTDVGSHNVTFTASDGALTDQKTLQLSVLAVNDNASMVYQENFDTGLPSSWTESGASSNVDWLSSNGALQAAVIGSGGYSFFAPSSLNLSNINDLAIEYDVTFRDGAKWGGLVFRGIHLDVNGYRSGWRDGSYEGYSGSYEWYSGLSVETAHHVTVFIHQGTKTSDLYIDGKPIFQNEPIQAPFANNTAGFVSNYFKGSVLIDNFLIRDLSLLNNASPLNHYQDFSSTKLNEWIMGGVTSNVQWSVANGQLSSTVVGSGGYSFFWPYTLDVSGKNITIEYDVAFKDGTKWGGLVYRGIHLDVNVNRSGWRDGSYEGLAGSYQWYPGLSADATHHVKLVIRQASPYPVSDLYIDGALVFQNEPIQTNTFSHNSIGFASSYFQGSIAMDNLTLTQQ